MTLRTIVILISFIRYHTVSGSPRQTVVCTDPIRAFSFPNFVNLILIISHLELEKELFPSFRKCLRNVRSSLFENDAGTGRHGEGENSFPAYFRSSPRRPIPASPSQLNQRFPFQLTSPFPNKELISLRVLNQWAGITSLPYN